MSVLEINKIHNMNCLEGMRQMDADSIDLIVTDPFMGSGTTAISCRVLNRKFIGFELSPDYHKIAEARIKQYMEQEKLSAFF